MTLPDQAEGIEDHTKSYAVILATGFRFERKSHPTSRPFKDSLMMLRSNFIVQDYGDPRRRDER